MFTDTKNIITSRRNQNNSCMDLVLRFQCYDGNTTNTESNNVFDLPFFDR